MDAAGIECVMAPRSGCCGAIRSHLSDEAGGLDDMRRNIDAWWPLINSGAVEAIVRWDPKSATEAELRTMEQHLDQLGRQVAEALLAKGVYVIGFSFPVVPRGQARIRTQMSAAHSFDQIDRTVEAFTTAGKELGVI